MHFSILDLAPVPEGSKTAQALANSLELARNAEAWTYHRFWLAEHHNMPGIASAATSVLIGYIAGGTRSIRVGAGGIMLPNHAPLAIAEQFGTLATLYPGRIDLGLGRAPGGDQAVAHALRRSMDSGDGFPADTVELINYLGPSDRQGGVRAHPGEGTRVPVWILGSSLYGAQMAAHFGLPYAFASHFAPATLERALAVYREGFRPSEFLQRPYVMLAANAFVADTDSEGAYLATTMQLAFARLRQGRPGRLPRPVADIDSEIGPQMRVAVDEALKISVIGSRETAKARFVSLLERYRPDELILTGQIHDHSARLKSFRMASEVLTEILQVRADLRRAPLTDTLV